MKFSCLLKPNLRAIQDIILKTLTDGRVSDFKFEPILSEQKRYRTLKQELHHTAKKKTDAITDDQREAILVQVRDEGRNVFLKEWSTQIFKFFLISYLNSSCLNQSELNICFLKVFSIS